MPQFDRSVKVQIGKVNQTGLEISGLRTTFKIKKTSTTDFNTAKVELYNLNEKSRGYIEGIGDDLVAAGAQASDDIVTVIAGYKGAERAIYIGNITLTNTEVKRPEVITTLEALDGLKAINELKFPSANYRATYSGENVSAKRVLQDVVKQVALPLANTNWRSIADKQYRKGFAFVGAGRVLLTNVCVYLGLEWSVQNNELKLVPVNASDELQVVSLDPTNGLIESPQRLQDASSYLHAKKDSRSAVGKSTPAAGKVQKKKVLGGLKVRCLLRPEVDPGNIVQIASERFPQALYRVVEVEHTGDTHGNDWTTTMVVMPL